MKNSPKVRFRPAGQEDVNFIFNSWLKSYRNSYATKNITSTFYFSEHHKVIERVLAAAKTIIACNPEDPSQVYGYVVADTVDGIFVVHYLYVKHSFRGLGLGKLLFNAFDHDPTAASLYTHHTHMAHRLAAKYNMLHHPYILMNYPQYGIPAVTEEAADIQPESPSEINAEEANDDKSN